MPAPAPESAPSLPSIAVDRRLKKPLYRQLYESLRAAILDGRLRPGQRLPSTRGLAAELALSRLPVLLAFELLLAEGFCEGRVGAGTFVSTLIPVGRRSAATAEGTPAPTAALRPVASSAAALVRAPSPWLARSGAFRVGDAAFDRFPLSTWKRLATQQARRLDANQLRYTDPLGHLPLREAIANYLGAMRGVRCGANQILVTSGSQQALSIAARALLDPGATAWIEEPGYWGVREVLRSMASKIVPITVDQDGLDVMSGIAQAPGARAVFVTPSHQFPLGATLSAARRLRLLDWAARKGSWIVEDDYDSEYRHDGQPVAALHSLDQNQRVIYIGTFSKVLFGALRLGFLVLPPDLVPVFSAVRRSNDISPATFPQAILAEFIRGGHFARHLRRMRLLYRERRDALVGALRDELGSAARLHGGSAGLHLVLELESGSDDREIATRATASGLATMPLSFCRTAPAGMPGLVLGYGGTDSETLRLAARKLAELLSRR